MYRYDIINRFVVERFRGDCKYLEIGLQNPKNCHDHIQAKYKTSVDPGEDPGMRLYNNPASYPVTSDEFFLYLEMGHTEFDKNHKWDVIFIDGMHLADYCYRDITNSLNHISSNGVIILHDCNPESWESATSNVEMVYNNYPMAWNGTVWKSFYYYRTQTKFLTYTVDTDHGTAVIDTKYSSEPITHTNVFFDYRYLLKNKKYDLGLISVEEFMNMNLQ